jgi:phage gp46-like protein
MKRITDLALAPDRDGIYDLVIDKATRDLVATDGLDSASFVSLFSDRRAHSDEESDPLKRRGWIGDTLSDAPNDAIGSGLWLLEQSRITPDIVARLQHECIASHQWMKDEGLAVDVDAEVVTNPAKRSASVRMRIKFSKSGPSSLGFSLAQNTKAGSLYSTNPAAPHEARENVIQWGGFAVTWNGYIPSTWG